VDRVLARVVLPRVLLKAVAPKGVTWSTPLKLADQARRFVVTVRVTLKAWDPDGGLTRYQSS